MRVKDRRECQWSNHGPLRLQSTRHHPTFGEPSRMNPLSLSAAFAASAAAVIALPWADAPPTAQRALAAFLLAAAARAAADMRLGKCTASAGPAKQVAVARDDLESPGVRLRDKSSPESPLRRTDAIAAIDIDALLRPPQHRVRPVGLLEKWYTGHRLGHGYTFAVHLGGAVADVAHAARVAMDRLRAVHGSLWLGIEDGHWIVPRDGDVEVRGGKGRGATGRPCADVGPICRRDAARSSWTRSGAGGT